MKKTNQNIALITLHSSFSHSSFALASLKAACHQESFYDQITCHEWIVNAKFDSLIEELVKAQPKIIGFSAYLWNINASIRLIKLLKQLLPESVFILGGPEPGARAQELMTKIPELDYVIHGEGEIAFRDLARLILLNQGTVEQVSGIHWRDQDKSIQINQTEYINLAELPSPFSLGLIPEKNMIYFETSRGCPNSCQFCVSSSEKARIYPYSRIEEDIQEISRIQPKVVKILDRSFHLGTARTLKLLELFQKTPEGITFHLELNPDRISEEIMQLFENAPEDKFQFEIGVQSIFDTTLKKVQRKMNTKKAWINIERIMKMKKHHLHLDLIAALPNETYQMCLDSLDKVFSFYPHHLQLGFLKLLPGTGLRRDRLENGYCWDQKPPYEVYSSNSIKAPELFKLRKIAELLERLWNSELLRNSIMYLVQKQYQNKISVLFEELLSYTNNELVDRNLQPDTIFQVFADFLLEKNWLENDTTMKELLLWDYCSKVKPSGKTNSWLQKNIQLPLYKIPEFGRQKLPRVTLGEKSVEIINFTRVEELIPDTYLLWIQRNQRKTPLTLFKDAEIKAREEELMQSKNK